jgi:hypothetical protein
MSPRLFNNLRFSFCAVKENLDLNCPLQSALLPHASQHEWAIVGAGFKKVSGASL